MEDDKFVLPKEILDGMAEAVSDMATAEESILYCKVFESSPEDVLSQLGETKEDILKMFIQMWMMRYVEENSEEL